MTTINTTDDLLSLLNENEEFREAVRRAILTDELLALPAVFTAFASEVRNNISEVRNDISGIRDDVGELKGIGLATKLYNRGPSLIATLLKVRGSERVRVAETDANSAEFNNAIYEAQDDGIITDDEYERILKTDTIIKSAGRGHPNPVYTVVESSYSVAREDIRKVKATATILGKVFPDAEIHTALYCMNIASFIEDEAIQRGVHLIRTSNLT